MTFRTRCKKLPTDEFGVTHVNILFNPEADRVPCILDTPNKDHAVENHHEIVEVKTTA